MLSTGVRMTKGNRVRRMQNFLLACGAVQEHRSLSFAVRNVRHGLVFAMVCYSSFRFQLRRSTCCRRNFLSSLVEEKIKQRIR